MIDVILALMLVLLGCFCIFLGGAIGSELPLLHGAQFIVAGFSSILMTLLGMLCFAVLIEM